MAEKKKLIANPYPSNHYGRWTEKESQVLREFWHALPTARLCEALPGRTLRAVTAQALKLGLKKSPERKREMGRENVSVRWQARAEDKAKESE